MHGFYRTCVNCLAAGLVCHCMHAGIKTPPAGALGSFLVVSAPTSVATSTTFTSGGVYHIQIADTADMVAGKLRPMLPNIQISE